MKALPFIYFSILFILNSVHKKNIMTVSNLLLGTYALSGLCFLIISNLLEYDINIFAAFYYHVCLSLLILPHVYFNEASIKLRIIELTPLIRTFCIVYFIIQLASILFYLPDAVDTIMGDIEYNRFLVNLGLYKDRGKTDLIFALIGASWPISLTMFFYTAAYREKLFYPLMFLLCSLFGVVYGIAHVGRSGLVQWIMLFLFNFILFRPYLKDSAKSLSGYLSPLKVINCLLFIVLVLQISIFSLITGERFLSLSIGDYSFGDVVDPFLSIVEYLGQMYGNFSEYYTNNWLDHKIFLGQFTSPLFCWILMIVGILPNYWHQTISSEVLSFHFEYGLQPGTFNTLLKELSIDYGLWGTLIICVIYFLVLLTFLRNKNRFWGLPAILIYTFIFSIPYYGIFFYSYGDSLSNCTMVYFIVSALLMSRLLRT